MLCKIAIKLDSQSNKSHIEQISKYFKVMPSSYCKYNSTMDVFIHIPYKFQDEKVGAPLIRQMLEELFPKHPLYNDLDLLLSTYEQLAGIQSPSRIAPRTVIEIPVMKVEKELELEKITSSNQPVEEEKEVRKEECVVCMEGKTDHAIIPCGHVCLCSNCVSGIKKCPICRADVTQMVKLFHV
jgi:hypothetical protein